MGEDTVIGVPRNSRHHVSRARLLRLLDDVPLIVVRAPAATGKTALVAEWARNQERAGLWVTMGDPVPTRLEYWRTVVTALADIDALDRESPLREPLREPTLRRTLVRGFARLRKPFTLIVDNHNVTDADVDTDLVTLAQHVDELTIAVAGRARTSLEHPRTQILVDTRVLGTKALAFTAAETEALLDRHVDEATTTDGRFVHELTGGHPGLLRAVIAHTQHRAEALVSREGLQEFLTLLVRAEVRRALQDPRQRPAATFVLRCSLADQMRPVLAHQFAADLLLEEPLEEGLHRPEMLGVMDVDAISGTLEVSNYLRALLRVEARTHLREELPELYATIARQEMEDGTPLQALRAASASGDLDLVSVVIARRWQHFLWDGILTDAEEHLVTVPREQLHRYPLVAGLLGLAANMDPNRRQRAVGLLSIAVEGARLLRRSAERGERFFLTALEIALGRIGGIGQDPLPRTLAAVRTLDEWSNHLVRVESEPIFRTQLAITLFRSGRLYQAADVLRDAVATDDDGPGVAPFQAMAIKAGIHAHLGTMSTSRRFLARADEQGWSSELRDSYLGVLGHYAAAWDRIDAFDPSGAQHHVDRIAPQHVNIEFAPYVALLQAHIRLLQGRANEALDQLTEDMRRMEVDQRMTPFERITLDKVSALLSLAAGRIGQTRVKLAGEADAALNTVVGAAMELSSGRPEEALARLAARQRELTTPRSAGPQRVVVAAALLRTGDRAGALNAAEQLIALMAQHEVRSHLIYVTHRDLVAIRDLLADERPDLVPVLGDVEQVPRVLRSSDDVGLLTKRENVVLQELSRTGSTSELAERLGVSSNTVKTQLRSIYRKLGATSRSDALAVAVREGLLRSR